MADFDLDEIGLESIRMVAAAISRRSKEVLAHWDRIGELGAEHDAEIQFAVMAGWATMVTYQDDDDMSGRWAVEVEVLRPSLYLTREGTHQ